MNFQKNILIVTATMLAACAFAPQMHAQLAPPVPPVTAGDAKDFKDAKELFDAQKWKEARTALQNFVDKYKMFSPHSRDAKLMLAVVSIQSKEFEMGVKQLRDLVGDKKVEPAAQAMAQLTIAKALTMLAFDRFPVADNETAAQKGARKKALENAMNEYDAFFTMFPKSKEGDSAHFLKGQVLVAMESYDLAGPEFGLVLQNFPNSTLRMDAQMWIGKAQFILANTMLIPKSKEIKEVPPADVKNALQIFDKAQQALEAVYAGGDVALQNEATFLMGQIQLTRSQHVSEKDEAKLKAKQMELQNLALVAFRSVRSVEEVVGAQEDKVHRLEQVIEQIAPGTQDYIENRKHVEILIGIEKEKADKYRTGQDQYLAARMSIARIFLFLEKYDECRVLLRALQMQKEALEKDKDLLANVAAMLCQTYAFQYKQIADTKNKASAHKCADKALETYEAFRTSFNNKDKGNKSNEAGENLPLIVANVLLQEDKVDKAEELLNQGMTDYNPWVCAPDAVRIGVGIKTKQGKYQEALDLVEKVLSGKVTPEIEEEILFQKGVILQQKGKAENNMTDTDKAVIIFGQVRDKFPKGPKAEEAWFALAQILSDRDAAKAIAELEKFIAKYEESGGLSENTAKNLPLAQYLLAKCRYQLGEKDPKNKEKAVIDYRKILEKWPDSEVGPNVLFKIFDIYNEKPDYQMCVKLMEEFVAKYPANENVYYAYNNIAELHFTGVLNTKTEANGKTIPAGPAGIKDLENGTKKLNEFADYEQSKGAEMKVKRGDTALLRIADRWLDELRKMPPFMTLNPEQKLKWQKIVDNVIAPIERQLKNYPAGPRLGEGLERLVKLQSARVKAQQTDAGQVEAYFKDLAAKYHSDQFLSAKIQAKLAEFLAETDPKRGFVVIEKIFKDVPEIVKNNGVITPSFSPLDYDRYLTGLFEAKRHDEVVKIIKRLREEYPADNSTAPENVVAEASAVALFWEGKELQEQGKNTDAGAKFDELTKKYPRSAKKMEADYGVILGDLESGKLKDEAKIREDLQRLADIVKISNTKTFELQAKALYLMGRLYEELKDYDSAVAAYVKISNRFASVPKVAGDGLWKGAQILEKQAKGEIKILTPEERKAANDKSAALIKAAAEKVKAETEKLNPSKAKDTKAQADKDAKPSAAKDAKAPVGKEAKPDAAKEPNASVDKNAKPDAPKVEKSTDKPAENQARSQTKKKNNLENHAQC